MAELPERVSLPIVYQKADEVPIQHANCFFVTHTDDEFFITFGQAHPPYSLQLTKEEVEELKATGLPVRVVARLMLSPIKMKEFIDILNDNYKKFITKKGD